MIKLTKEKVVKLAVAAKYLPERRRGKTPHPSCLYRWAGPGLRGCRLDTIRVGGTLCTSIEALQRFFDALTAADAAGAQPLPNRPSADVNVDVAVDQRLDQLGF
jgi:hypothetical protein